MTECRKYETCALRSSRLVQKSQSFQKLDNWFIWRYLNDSISSYSHTFGTALMWDHSKYFSVNVKPKPAYVAMKQSYWLNYWHISFKQRYKQFYMLGAFARTLIIKQANPKLCKSKKWKARSARRRIDLWSVKMYRLEFRSSYHYTMTPHWLRLISIENCKSCIIHPLPLYKYFFGQDSIL